MDNLALDVDDGDIPPNEQAMDAFDIESVNNEDEDAVEDWEEDSDGTSTPSQLIDIVLIILGSV
jgi:hypothetical protein